MTAWDKFKKENADNLIMTESPMVCFGKTDKTCYVCSGAVMRIGKKNFIKLIHKNDVEVLRD